MILCSRANHLFLTFLIPALKCSNDKDLIANCVMSLLDQGNTNLNQAELQICTSEFEGVFIKKINIIS